MIDAYADGVRFVAGVGEVCQDAVPDVRLGASFVDVATRDADLAGRIEAALAAGGKVVYDEEAPAFIVLADPQGNKVCLCTSEGR